MNNYRLYRNEFTNNIDLVEVYYDKYGIPWSCSPIVLAANTEQALRDYINSILSAFNYPTLTEADFSVDEDSD